MEEKSPCTAPVTLAYSGVDSEVLHLCSAVFGIWHHLWHCAFLLEQVQRDEVVSLEFLDSAFFRVGSGFHNLLDGTEEAKEVGERGKNLWCKILRHFTAYIPFWRFTIYIRTPKLNILNLLNLGYYPKHTWSGKNFLSPCIIPTDFPVYLALSDWHSIARGSWE